MYNYILTIMGIETKYDYTYYTVIDTEQWRRSNEDIWGDDGFTWEKAIDFINYKFKNSEDKSVNNYIVDYAQYCPNIAQWRYAHERHKERPVFVQFQEEQPIKTMGEGSLFVIYEEEEDEGYYHILPDGGGTAEGDTIDGLAGAGGRL